MNAEQIGSLAGLAAAPVYGVAVAMVLLTVAVVWKVARRSRTARPASAPDDRRAGHTSRRGEDPLTVLAAIVATGVAAQGMWRFFHDVLNLSGVLAAITFAFLELAMFTSALRARRNVAEFGSAGIDGVAVWVFTCLSATFAALDADSAREVPARLAAPLVAAWLWERGMAVQRRRSEGRRWHWRITPERILLRLGLAEPTDRTAAEVAANRHLNRVARAAKRLRHLQRTGAKQKKQLKALEQLEAAVERAVEHADLATDPARRQQLLARIEMLYTAAQLAELTPDSPWHSTPSGMAAVAPPSEPLPALSALSDLPDTGGSGTEGGMADGDASATTEPDAEVEGAVPGDLGADRTRAARTRRTRPDGVPVPALTVVPDVPAREDRDVLQAHQADEDDAEVHPPLGDEPVRVQAAAVFADELRAGQVPSIRRIKAALRCGQKKATQVRAYLATLPADAVAEQSAP
jgi:hypothetical protein